jgi:hypothetical protein
MKKYKVKVDQWGEFFKGQIIDESQIPNGTDVARSVSRGTIVPVHDGHEAVIDDNDAAGWKQRATELEADLAELRSVSVDADAMASHRELEAAHESLQGENKALKQQLEHFTRGSVARHAYDAINQEHQALRADHESIKNRLGALSVEHEMLKERYEALENENALLLNPPEGETNGGTEEDEPKEGEDSDPSTRGKRKPKEGK